MKKKKIRAIINSYIADLKDKDRLDWLEAQYTLHQAVEILYVVDGYEITSTKDGYQHGPPARGKTLRDAIDTMMGVRSESESNNADK